MSSDRRVLVVTGSGEPVDLLAPPGPLTPQELVDLTLYCAELYDLSGTAARISGYRSSRNPDVTLTFVELCRWPASDFASALEVWDSDPDVKKLLPYWRWLTPAQGQLMQHAQQIIKLLSGS